MDTVAWDRPRKLADEVVATLRTMILTGSLPAGHRTTQVELAQRLGVSTMPVREALLRLAAEGFVELIPNRSFTVVHTSQEDIRDVYSVHATLAGELTRRACLRADNALRLELREAERACANAHTGRDHSGGERANWTFHYAINAAARAPKLALLLRSTLRFVPRGFYSLIPEWADVSEQGHLAILEAMDARDADAAAAAASDHVLVACDLLIDYFTGAGHWNYDALSAAEPGDSTDAAKFRSRRVRLALAGAAVPNGARTQE